MVTVNIWALESKHDRETVKCLANKLVVHRQLTNLSIRVSGPEAKQAGPNGMRNATKNFLKKDDYVIFVIDRDGPMSLAKRRNEPNSLFSQIQKIVNDPQFADKVFFVEAVQELEAWLLIDCLGIICYFASQSPRYRKNKREKLSQDCAKLINHYQTGDTEKIVEAVSGGKGPKEYLKDFSAAILRTLNTNMSPKDVNKQKYKPGISARLAEYVVIDRDTLRRNNSLRKLGDKLAQFKC
jgi:hypothetical protein